MEADVLSLETPANQRNAVKQKKQLLKIPDKLNSSFEMAIPSEDGDTNYHFSQLQGDKDARMFFGFSSYLL